MLPIRKRSLIYARILIMNLVHGTGMFALAAVATVPEEEVVPAVLFPGRVMTPPV